jgi:hypothetical protein
MARRFFKRLMPKRERLAGEKAGWLRRLFANPNLWHLNRHSVARGVACGLWWAWIPIPLQSPGACFFAWKLKGNVPLAYACCWLSNPLTMLPAIYICYQLGLLVTFQESVGFYTEIKHTFTAIADKGFVAGIKHSWWFITHHIDQLWPFLVGCVVFSTLNAVVGFFGVHALWRWSVVRRWKKRGHKVHCRQCHRPLPHEKEQSCPHCNALSPHRTRIGLGLAAIARMARGKGLHSGPTL